MTTQRLTNQRSSTPSAVAQRKAVSAMWQERGYSDARVGRELRDRETLRALGGDAAVSAYFSGARLGKRRP